MIYVTGNMHGDQTRFLEKKIKRIKRKDTLFICGDFGFVWDVSPKEEKVLKWISKRRFKTIFIDGTHENFSLLKNYPEEELFGGRVLKLGKNLYKAIRGEVYEVENTKIFAFGGGALDDDEEEIEGVNWMVGEEITQEQILSGRKNLEAHGNVVDYVLTHDPPSKIKEFLTIQTEEIHQTNTFFDEVSDKVSFKNWIFGRYHFDKVISSRFTAVFKETINLEEKTEN